MAKVANDADLSRGNPCKALSPSAHLRYKTIQKVIRALSLLHDLHTGTLKSSMARK
ncbi:hypothetical protein ACJ51O_35620 (plasmid) [Burkholderia pyrrocinia]|uniref:hypothetical protein n=1 Tax=Burkholderia pyrrocinia TaxID=60550 RepID=UPI0038B66EA0